MSGDIFDRQTIGKLLRRLQRKVGDECLAEDSLQAAYARLVERQSRETIINPEGFLVKVATNIAIDERRRERTRRLHNQADDGSVDNYQNFQFQDEVLAGQERLIRVSRALARLPARSRDIFLMHRLAGYKYSEIALRYGITISAVEKQIAKVVLILTDDLVDIK